MDKSVKAPSKEEVRVYMQRQISEHRPPPSGKEIRRQLGWELIETMHKNR